jgi:hypothetical protein
MKNSPSALLKIQGFYLLITSLWSLLDIHSFMKITGPKTDLWLVKSFSLILICIALSCLYSGFTRQFSPAVYLMASSIALVLFAIDVYYPLKGVIRKVYMADGYVHLIFLILWTVSFFRMRSSETGRSQ